jgi:translation initiation factor 1A
LSEEEKDEELIFKRLRLPHGKEVFGRVTEMLSSDRLRVECSDGRERIGRIPGRLRKRVWVRKGDLIIIEPWKIQGDIRGDMIWRYTKNQEKILRKRGLLTNLNLD